MGMPLLDIVTLHNFQDYHYQCQRETLTISDRSARNKYLPCVKHYVRQSALCTSHSQVVPVTICNENRKRM